MKLQQKGSKTKKASSLLEVLIVIGIISTTLVVSTNLVIKSLTQVRINELEDRATNVLVKGMEVAKAPTAIVADTIPDQINTTYSYSIVENPNGNFFENQQGRLTDCNPGNDYEINFGLIDSENDIACLEVSVTPRGNSDIDYYEVNAVIIYLSGQYEYSNILKGIRYDDFETP